MRAREKNDEPAAKANVTIDLNLAALCVLNNSIFLCKISLKIMINRPDSHQLRGKEAYQETQPRCRSDNLSPKSLLATNRCTCAPSQPVCNVRHDPSRALGDLTGIKKHFCSMVRRSGNVTNAPRDMLYNPTGKLTLRSVPLGSTDVTVAPFSQGTLLPKNHYEKCALSKS
ncbi:hypothetical protein Cgig2_007207 [Carnegiea gigantea]|uniref:BIRD-IDD transcription factor second C2H2 zinc finger domain-containing protein n=1 Tax=Carnegiea gigantea TaxID=171969 RepID=A0A9Q1QRR0_9CARY|nr:hypothetical protein Cgig2_007207 [Carnegiea gigantea]